MYDINDPKLISITYVVNLRIIYGGGLRGEGPQQRR